MEDFSRILEKLNDSIVIVQNGEVKYINDKVIDMLGFSKEEIIGESLCQFIASEYREKVIERHKNRLEGMDPVDKYEIELISEDSKRIPVEINVSRIEYKDKPATVTVIRNITKRKEQEQKLKEERALTRSIFRSVPDLVYAFDTDGNFLRVSESNTDVTGYTLEEHEEMSPRDFFTGKDKKKITKTIINILNTGESRSVQADIVTKNGEKIPYEFRASRMESEDGEILGVAGIGRDISESKKREKELKKQKKELERQNKHLEDFADLISHEIRNPLNIAKLNLESYENKDEIVEVKNALDRVQNIIDSLLVYTKTGQTIEEKEKVDLKKISERCWKNVIIDDKCNLSIKENIELNADKEMLKHLLENLFKNAAENGASKVIVGSLDNGFYIEDNGSGIPEEKREKIFDLGYSDKGGTGLGLGLVDQIVKGHNWDISVKESQIEGTRFEITYI